MARGKNEVTLTFAGDDDQLQRTFDAVGESADQMAKEVGGASDRMSREVRSSTASFDAAAEATDTLDTRSMGFRDTLTGVQDSVSGFSRILKGDFAGDALLTAGAGVGDLASGFTNALIPGLKSARGALGRATTAVKSFVTTTRGATLALGGIGIVLAALGAAFLIFRKQQDEVEVSTENLVTDLERFQNTGRVTGEIVKILGDDASELKGRLQALDPALRENRSNWDKVLDGFRATRPETDKLKDELEDLDEGLAQFVAAGGDGEQVLDELAEKYNLNEREMGHVVEALPRYRKELERAEERQRDASGAVADHINNLEDLGKVLKEQTDPVFAFVRAQQGVEEAQQAVNEAQEEFGKGSPEHEQALLDLAAAEIGLTSATVSASEAVNGTLLPVLEQMRDDGILSKGAFEQLKNALEDAKDEADNLDGTRASVTLEQTLITRFQQTGRPPPGHVPGGTDFLPGGHFHTGGVVPGPMGQEVLAVLQAGERVVPLSEAKQGPVLEIRSGGSRMDDLLVEILAHSVRTRGGDVQLVLGGGGSG